MRTVFESSWLTAEWLWVALAAVLGIAVCAVRTRLLGREKTRALPVAAAVLVLAVAATVAVAGARVMVPVGRGEVESVSGTVENFSAPEGRFASSESFSVNGVQFEYDRFDFGFGFHKTGVLSEGDQVEMEYVELDGKNVIVRLRVQ